jgi:hypothetical protein
MILMIVRGWRNNLRKMLMRGVAVFSKIPGNAALGLPTLCS